jgi:putative transposase
MMKKSRFTEEQIVALLKEAEAGAKVRELCLKHGISGATFYKWRSKYGSLELSGGRSGQQLEAENLRLKQLEEENRRLRALVADLTLSNQTLKLVVTKKW